jgi:chromosome partitioning protein
MLDKHTRAQLGRTLKYQAQLQGKTQQELAESMEMHVSVISRVWRGLYKKPTHYARMADVLGVELFEQQEETSTSFSNQGGFTMTHAPQARPGGELAAPLQTRTPISISVASLKGGVGKTTTTINLAACLAERGYEVVVVDLDGQANATDWIAPERDLAMPGSGEVIAQELDPREILHETTIERVRLLAATESLQDLEKSLGWGAERRLRRLMRKVDADIVLYDCPPSQDVRVVSAMMASDWVIVPVKADALGISGAFKFLPWVLDFQQEDYNPSLGILGVLLVCDSKTKKVARDARNIVQKDMDGLGFKTTIRDLKSHGECPSYFEAITTYDRDAAREYRALTNELLERLGDQAPSPRYDTKEA